MPKVLDRRASPSPCVYYILQGPPTILCIFEILNISYILATPDVPMDRERHGVPGERARRGAGPAVTLGILSSALISTHQHASARQRTCQTWRWACGCSRTRRRPRDRSMAADAGVAIRRSANYRAPFDRGGLRLACRGESASPMSRRIVDVHRG